MMVRTRAASMPRPAACPPAPGRLTAWPAGALLAALLPWVHLPPATAGPPPEPEFPSTATLRKVQLTAFECARDNTAESCALSRKLSDGLMDNPLLSVSCKDDLWDIRQKSVQAPTNSFQRREALSDAAEKLINICKPTLKPLGSTPKPAAPERPRGLGFGLN